MLRIGQPSDVACVDISVVSVVSMPAGSAPNCRLQQNVEKVLERTVTIMPTQQHRRGMGLRAKPEGI
jgi:hypothetical protein